jgi:hypothetical protein
VKLYSVVVKKAAIGIVEREKKTQLWKEMKEENSKERFLEGELR